MSVTSLAAEVRANRDEHALLACRMDAATVHYCLFWTVAPSIACIDRAMRIYDATIRAIEERGHVVEIQSYKREGYAEPLVEGRP